MMDIRLNVDESGIVASFLVRLILGLAIVGFLVIEGGNIVWTKLKAQDAAESAAVAAADSFFHSRDVDVAREAAIEAIGRKDEDARLVEPFEIDRDGTVHVTVVKRAKTVLAGRIDFLKGLTVARATAVGRPAQPGF